MKIYVTDDYKGMSRKAANLISAQVIMPPEDWPQAYTRLRST